MSDDDGSVYVAALNVGDLVKGHYVAFQDGELIDSDAHRETLLEHLPKESFYIRKTGVEPHKATIPGRIVKNSIDRIR
jgi:uncharacterized protein (DUF2344 family)